MNGRTSQIQRYGRIALSSVSAIVDMHRNGYMHRSTGAKIDTRSKGMFHTFDGILSHAIVKVAMKNVPIIRERNNKDLELQATA